MGREIIQTTTDHAPAPSVLPHCCKGELHNYLETHSWHYQPHSRCHLKAKIHHVLFSCPTGRSRANPNSWSAERTLTHRLQQLLQHSLAPSTQTTYNAGLHRFYTFCAEHNTSTLPTTKQTVTYFAVSLSQHLSPSTIRVYTSAIRAVHVQAGLPDPTVNNVHLKLVLTGIRRQYLPTTTRQRTPIRPRLLATMLHSLSRSHNLPHQDYRMLSAAFTLAFHGFLRVSEFTTPPHTLFNPRLHPSACHVHLSRKSYTFHLPHSKTDQFHHGHTIHITRSTS